MGRISPQKIVNLITAFVVLIGGLWIIIFLPTGLSPIARLIIGVAVVLYFVLRMKMIRRKSASQNEGG